MRRFLEGAGRVGTDLLAVDWDRTPLGQPEQWPPALTNSVRILLTSKFSMWMAWGEELTFFCNDAYRRDTLGSKYPWALGRPASEVWSEIWPDIGPRIDRVMTTGEATWDENLQLFLERSGFVEETYHTFSYSPLAADDGSTAGMLCVVKEDTEEVISARRMATIRDLGIRRSGLTEAETLASVCDSLAQNSQSLPFTLIYRFEPDGRTAVRVGSTGFTEQHHPAAPSVLDATSGAPWPVAAVLEGQTVVVDDLESRFEGLPTGGWPDPPSGALVAPLVQAAHSAPYGFLVAGLNRYRPLDDSSRGFVALIASHLSAALTDARSYEFERERAETLARLDRAKTDFFTNVSHEFRTPLTLLLGPAEDALADDTEPLPPHQQRRLEVIHRNAQRLLKQVNSLLDFSRLESGKVSGRFEKLDLARYTRELATMFESAAEQGGIRLEVDCEPLPVRPYVDAEHWAKIVLNLVSNALKFTFDGSITVRLREVDGAAVLTVADTGVGIPESELPHLFERFHRVPGTRSRTYEGSGIGLALVSELAALHGGTVAADSTPGEGTTFTVTVPFGSAHLPPDLVVEEPPAEEGVAREVTSQVRGFVTEAMRWVGENGSGTSVDGDGPDLVEERPTVLVVDDNADMRDYVAALLSAEYDVTTAEDGLDALAKVGAVRPDLVLTDVMMPRLDGFGLLERLHADPATTGVPVIMLSARAGEEGTVEGLDAGADDYLVKPFSARELLARVRVNLELDKVRRVRSALESSQSLLDQAQRLARVGSWEIDLATEELRASSEMKRLLELPDDGTPLRWTALLEQLVRDEDRELVRTSLEHSEAGSLIEYDAWVVLPSGTQRLVTVRGEVVEALDGRPSKLRGSVQDVTERRQAEQALATAAARERAAEREHAIADQLQRSLLPQRTFEVEHLEVATFYRAGVEGTQVGGDWYDIIELGAGRTALVVGDVMGRGVSAAAGMGQLRSAVRAFSKLDLPPAEMLEYLDGLVQDMGGDQIVTCFYAIFDSTDQTLRYANAGHLPALLMTPGEPSARLSAAGPPLGAGYFGMRTESVRLALGATVVLYTDGLVERRSQDIDVGIDILVSKLDQHAGAAVDGLPELLVEGLLPEGPHDDIAILVARVDSEPFEAAVSHRLVGGERAVAEARRMVSSHLRSWEVGDEVSDEVVLMASELVTNAFMHGRAPIDLRLRRTGSEIVFEVQDRAVYRPRRRRAADDDENGRGLHIVSVLADRWGSRATGSGKSVWFSKTLSEN